MTTHDDLETRLRSSLRDRAGDVDTTPALYERVQRQANRSARLVRGLAVAGAAAVVVAAVAIIPRLLPDTPFEPDIADIPDGVQPTENQTDAAAGLVPATLAGQLTEAGVAYAADDGSGGSVLQIGQRTIVSSQQVVAMDVATSGASTALVVGFANGSLGGVDLGGTGDQFDQMVDANANGSKAIVAPGVDGIAWIEGTMLYVLPFADGAEPRGMPLEGDVPGDLRLEQWVARADAQVLLASSPEGGVWSILMDDSNIFNTAPTDPAFVLPGTPAEATDVAILPDLSTWVTVPAAPDQPARLERVGGEVLDLDDTLAGQLSTSADPVLTTLGSRATVHDGSTGATLVLTLPSEPPVDGPEIAVRGQAAGLSAVAPLPIAAGQEEPGDAGDGEPEQGNASELGLPIGSPLLGTAGTDLLVRFADGEVRTLPLFPSGESEASLGRLAVMPGSTTEYGLIAVESFSEAEYTIRFGGLRDGEVGPIGDAIIVDGPVTGLVWSEDSREIAWTDTTGLHVATVDAAGEVASEELLRRGAPPVLDWVWEEVGDTATGHLTVSVAGGTGVERLVTERAADGTIGVSGTAGGSDRLVFDVHTDVGRVDGVEVLATPAGGTAELSWVAAGDRSGPLADPGQLGGDVRVRVSGGHVLVMGDGRQALVTFDGDVIDLPTAADWDVLD